MSASNLYVGMAIDTKRLVMAKKITRSSGASDQSINVEGQRSRAGTSSRPTIEDGLRLIHAFMHIKEAALREAVIRLVTEISSLSDGKR